MYVNKFDMAGWEEIERLKSDFKLVQLSNTKQKLSERNVIEIVRKLIDLKLLDVIYTLDGKEYLTPQGLTKEIQDELITHGGRINLVELQQILNVDFSHIESKASEIVKHDRNITLVLGQLIDNTYLDRIAEEVNDRLQEQGHITIAELTQLYDLPADFLSENIHERVGTIIKGQVDSYDRDVIFTDSFISRMKAQIKGAFSAVTCPLQMTSIMHRYGFQERLFYSILEELVASKRLAGTISGGRQEKALYIPDIYTKSQNDWVDSFYKQNGYLEYDSLTRLGITDPKSFIKKRFKSEPITYLSTCCAGSALKEQMEASAEDALQSDSWVDILPLLPSVFSRGDANQILTECIKKLPRAVIYCETIVASEKLITNCIKPFENLVKKKAEKDAKSNPALFNPESQKTVKTKLLGADDGSLSRDEKKEQRKKKAASSSKSGGGTQGREVKTKSVKKKGRAGGRDQRDDSDEEGTMSSSQGKEAEIFFMTIEEIEEKLKNQKELRDCPEEFLTEIAQHLYRPLSKQYQEVAKSVFLQTAGADTGTGRKKTHGELQEKLLGLWQNCLIFDKGLKNFTGETQTQLAKHLLKTVCTDITNIVVNSFGTEYMLSVGDESQLTSEGMFTDMVLRHMKLQGDESKEDKGMLEAEMQKLLPQVKDFVLKAKKGSQTQEEQS
ncbi:hypothetical protein KUTeg_008000 [Tegillarca granosa]|uniref:E3 UFM1-protein ligase 1 n=1 Tax=Tegillarca granosa TaxID=220873 RepID=A0ABQ9FHT5_TEGGR|nr:hypothetical protein KUTeg_008000 [Tegillarca granosa]